MTLILITKLKIHQGEVTIIKLSHDGKLVASGDNKKNVFIWSSETKEITCDRFVYHSSKIYSIDWSSDDTLLASSSLDRSVIIWNIAEKSKVKVFSDVDIEVVYTVGFLNGDKEFVCGGHSCAIRKFII